MTTDKNQWMFACFIAGLLCFGCSSQVEKKNMDRNAALSKVDFPLTLSASNVFLYKVVEGTQCFLQLARFDVSPNEIDSAISMIVSNNNTMLGRCLPYGRRAIPKVRVPTHVIKEKNLFWWEVEAITNGFYVGEDECFAVRLWVDNDRHRIYLYEE